MSGKVELLIDDVHYYILVFTDCAVNPHLDFHIKETDPNNKKILLSRVWWTLRTTWQSRGRAIILRPKWLLMKIP